MRLRLFKFCQITTVWLAKPMVPLRRIHHENLKRPSTTAQPPCHFLIYENERSIQPSSGYLNMRPFHLLPDPTPCLRVWQFWFLQKGQTMLCQREPQNYLMWPLFHMTLFFIPQGNLLKKLICLLTFPSIHLQQIFSRVIFDLSRFRTIHMSRPGECDGMCPVLRHHAVLTRPHS